MIELSDAQVLFAFGDDTKPALTVKSGETVRIRTQDCFSNQLCTPADSLDTLDWDRVNPATGPIFVEDAHPGDVLKVTIERIELDEQAAVATGENEGTLGDIFKDGLVSVLKPVRDGHLIWDENLSLPLRPMIGVIGVAPAGEPVNCGTPGSHGGNMDNTMITTGATLYFPVAVEGALFGLGDMHAVMGDGEIGVSGAEIAGYATVTLEVLHDRTLTNPVLENEFEFATIASAETLDKAASVAVHDMHAHLLERTQGYTSEELGMIMSLAADVEVCQIVDPLKTARVVLPKSVTESLGFSW